MKKLTPKELEVLIILIEECAEVIKVCSKIKRFGWEDYHPDDTKKTPNVTKLEQELGDVLAMLHHTIDLNRGVTEIGLEKAYSNKMEKLKKFTEHLK